MFGPRFQQAFLAWFALTGLALGSGAAGFDEGIGTNQSYRVIRWTAEQGLPQNSIKALLQTRDGYLWIGTLYGLARFDGVKFKVFDESNTPEMTHDSINALAEDEKDGSLWIATGDGLLRYRDHRFQRYGPEHGVIGTVGLLWPARQGGVWFPPGIGRVGLFRDSRVKIWEFDPARVGNNLLDLSEESPSRLLVRIDYSVYQFELSTGSLKPLAAPPGEFSCHSFFRDTDGSLWLCAPNGIWHGTEGHWTHVVARSPEVGPLPVGICRTADGQLWVTMTESGRNSLRRLADDGLQPVAAPEFLADANVTRMIEDNEGNFWIGTEAGLLQLRASHLQVYSTKEGLASDNTQSVTLSQDGTVWVGTSRGFNGIRDGRVFNLHPPASEGGRLWTLVSLADSAGSFWFGTGRDYLTGYRDGNWARLEPPPELSGIWGRRINPSALYEDWSHRIWIGTGDGVACADHGRWTYYATTNDAAHTSVRVIHQDRRGDMWFGVFGGGLNRLRDGHITVYRTDLGEYNNRAWWIHEDADGVFWVGSQKGLNRFVPPGVDELPNPKSEIRNRESRLTSRVAEAGAGRFFTFTTQHGLHENIINNIQEDDFGYLWLSGLRGIYRVARQDLNEVAAGGREEVQVLALGEGDGMLSSECNGGDYQPAGCKDPAGRIWFPTAKGLVVIDSKTTHRNDVPPPVVIEKVIADGEVIFGDDAAAQVKTVRQGITNSIRAATAAENPAALSRSGVRFAPGRARVLEIRYTANSFVASERVRFKYRIEGWDRDWHWDNQNRRVAFYTNLRPGTYAFHVSACNSHGVWNEAGERFAFSIAPYFWETWPFYAACATAVVGAAAGLQGYRLKWQRHLLKLEQQRALANERTRIARDLHDDLGTALTGLALEIDVIRRDTSITANAPQRLREASNRTRDLADRMREVVWAVNPRCDTLSSLASFLEQQTAQFLQADGIHGRLDFPEQIPSLNVEANVRHQLALAVREALTNVVRHARASEVVVKLDIERDSLLVSIRDNGCGFDVTQGENPGHGLANSRERLESAGGTFQAESAPGRGAAIILRVPLQHATPPDGRNAG